MVPGGMSLDLKSLFGLECFYNSRAHGREDQGEDNHTHTTDPPVLAGWDEGRWAIVSHLRSFLSASIGISGHLQLTPRTILLSSIEKDIRRLNPSTEKDPVRIPSVRGSLCWSA